MRERDEIDAAFRVLARAGIVPANTLTKLEAAGAERARLLALLRQGIEAVEFLRDRVDDIEWSGRAWLCTGCGRAMADEEHRVPEAHAPDCGWPTVYRFFDAAVDVAIIEAPEDDG